MKRAVALLILVVLLASCGGGGTTNPDPNPNPQPKGPNMNGLFMGNFGYFYESIEVVEANDSPFVLLNTGIDQYSFVDNDGSVAGTLSSTATTFSILLQDEGTIETGEYRFSASLNGALTASSLNGGGTTTVTLISGIDAADIDGLTLDVTLNATREGIAPIGTAADLSGEYLAELEVIDPPELDMSSSGNLTFAPRSPGIYDVTDDDATDPFAMTLVAIGTTWYMLAEDYIFEDTSEYREQYLFSGTIGQSSLTGAGIVSWESMDGTDFALLHGAEMQMDFQAAKIN